MEEFKSTMVINKRIYKEAKKRGIKIDDEIKKGVIEVKGE